MYIVRNYVINLNNVINFAMHIVRKIIIGRCCHTHSKKTYNLKISPYIE